MVCITCCLVGVDVITFFVPLGNVEWGIRTLIPESCPVMLKDERERLYVASSPHTTNDETEGVKVSGVSERFILPAQQE